MRLICFVVIVILCVGVVESDIIWDGSESSNWSNPGNWVEGRIPDNENVYITGDGYAPTNQDIFGLNIGNIYVKGYEGRIDVYGEPFSMGCVNIQVNSNQTFAIWQDVTFNSTAGFQAPSGCKVELHGNLYEQEGLGYNLRMVGGGIFEIYGTNYCTGGVQGYQGSLNIYKGVKGLGVEPESFDSDAIRLHYGTIKFYSPITGGCYDIDTGLNRGIYFGNDRLDLIGRDIRMLINSDITSAQAVFGYTATEDGGEFWLNKTNMLKGSVSIGAGLVYLNNSNVVQDVADDTYTVKIITGTIDLNGNNLLSRNISYNNYSGVYDIGGIINSNTNTPSVIDGDFTQMCTGGENINFGGDGEIILEGNIGVANSGSSLYKAGNGAIRLRGTTTGNSYVKICGGQLILDYKDNTEAKIPSDQDLRLYSADLVIEPNASSSVTVQISRLYNRADFGYSSISIASSLGAAMDIDIDDFDISSSTSLDISVKDGGAGVPHVFTSESEGSMNPDITLNKNILAQVENGEIVAESDYIDVADNTTFENITTIENLNITGSFTAGTPGARARSLRFDGSAILNLTEALSLSSVNNGGVTSILVPEGTGDVEIHGGDLDAGVNCNTHVFNYDADSTLTLGSRLGGGFSSGDKWHFIGPGRIVLTNESNKISDFSICNDVVVEFSDFGVLGVGNIVKSSGGTLRYVGAGESDGKTIQIYQTTTIDASGTGELFFSETGDVVSTSYGNNNDIILTGSGIGRFAGKLNIIMGDLIKKGSGKWILSAAQDYVGKTEVIGGELEIKESVARDVYVGEDGILSGAPDIGRDFTTEGTVIIDLTAGKTMTVGCTATLGGSLVFEGDLLDGEELVLLEAATIIGNFENIPEKYNVTVLDNEVVVTKAPPQGTLFIVQ